LSDGHHEEEDAEELEEEEDGEHFIGASVGI